MFQERPTLIDPFRCLMDREYQRWLTDSGALVVDGTFDPGRDLQFRQGKSPNLAELAVLDLLKNRAGEVITHPEIVDRLAEMGIDKNMKQLTSSFFPHLRWKLERSSSIVKINELGRAVGVKSFKLRFTGVWILHYFWEHPNHSIALEDLARRIYGGTDRDDRMAIAVQMVRLKQALKGTSVGLRNLNRGNYPGVYWMENLEEAA